MAKKRVKKRTHVGAKGTPAMPGNTARKPGDRSPKSMVIRIGASEVGPAVSQLVRDVRSVMEPETASRLKERRSNSLRDYTTMAGPLGVTHMLLFSRSKSGNTNLRLALTPRGPTLHFRVEKYSLCKDIAKSQRKPRMGGAEYITAPLLVMNNFTSKQKPDEAGSEGANKSTTKDKNYIPKQLESLMTTVFQSLFPPINPTATSLKSIKRVLLLDRVPAKNPADANTNYVLNLRHYAIETRTAKSVPKPLRRLDAADKLSHSSGKKGSKRGGLPDLSRLDDVADYLLDPHAADGFTSASESEPDTDAEVEVTVPTSQRVERRSRRQADNDDAEDRPAPSEEVRSHTLKKGIKLHELGPRLKLRLTKVEEGMCNGRIMWHEYMHKTDAEIKELDRVHEERRKERERRREEQKANVERKQASKKRARGQKSGEEGEREEEEDDEDDVAKEYFSGDDEWLDDDDEMDNEGVEDEDEEMDG